MNLCVCNLIKEANDLPISLSIANAAEIVFSSGLRRSPVIRIDASFGISGCLGACSDSKNWDRPRILYIRFNSVSCAARICPHPQSSSCERRSSLAVAVNERGNTSSLSLEVFSSILLNTNVRCVRIVLTSARSAARTGSRGTVTTAHTMHMDWIAHDAAVATRIVFHAAGERHSFVVCVRLPSNVNREHCDVDYSCLMPMRHGRPFGGFSAFVFFSFFVVPFLDFRRNDVHRMVVLGCCRRRRRCRQGHGEVCFIFDSFLSV